MQKIASSALLVALFTLPVQADPLHVVTDIAPVHSLVSMVMAGTGVPEMILPPGASPHHYSMRPSEAAALEQADLIFWVGDALTPWLEKPMQTLAPSALHIALADTAGTEHISTEAAHDHDGHGALIDPHLWLSPDNGAAWLREISTQLSTLDPENTVIYTANAALAITQITQMKADVAASLSHLNELKYITFHDSFGYFEQAFELPASAHIIGLDEAPANAHEIAELNQWVTDNTVTCLLAAPGASPGLIANVFTPLAPKVAVADPLGTALTPGPQLYPDLIREIASALASCQQ